MTLDVLCFRGTGEPRVATGAPQGMLSAITSKLDPTVFRCRELAWPAQIGPTTGGVSLNSSVRIGADMGCDAIRATPNLVILLGYSLGALVVNEILSRIANDSRHADLQVAAVCNVANPGRAAGQSVLNLCPPTYYGLNGAHHRWPQWVNPNAVRRTPMMVLEYANPGDIITSASPDSPVRRISDAIAPFSILEGVRFGDPGAQLGSPIEWVQNAERRDMWQPWTPAFWQRYGEAIAGLRGYLAPFPSEHTCYPVRKMPGQSLTYTEHAAQTLNRRFGGKR